ncbi:FATC domain protein [Cooperia oncophora]
MSSFQAMEVTVSKATTVERVSRLLRTNRKSLVAVLEANEAVPDEKHDVTRRKTLHKAPRIVRERVINRIKHRPTGSDFGVDVQEQVDRLVEQATLHENLCQCYIGWCHFGSANNYSFFVVLLFIVVGIAWTQPFSISP